ncbi:RHS repeat-associated core domain-containing protein, partial [Pseudomonas syringae group genomosp. 3]
AWGNLIEKIVGIVRWQTFTYDSENRLVKTETMANSQVETTSSYQYDSLGRRVGKQSNIKGRTDQKHFLWQGLRMLREESPEQSSLYLYEPGSYAPLARVDQREGEDKNKVYYYHTDQIGTPLEMTDAEGHIVWQAKYAPWGLIKQLVVNKVEQNLRFQGQYFDVETGLHYNTFRYYDPEIGRFITQDPIGLSGGDNLYLYAPNPYGWVDYLGLACSSLHDQVIREANKVASLGGSITSKQAQILKGNLPVIQRRTVFQNQMARKEFVGSQNYLMKQWEANTGRAWPSGATPHHIIPLESGGANKWWNLMPTNGKLPNHSLPGIPGPHAAGGVLRGTIQQSRKALPPGTITDMRL